MSDKCVMCGIRNKRKIRNKVWGKYCSRCEDVGNRKRWSEERKTRRIVNLVGEKYQDADIASVEVEYRDRMYELGQFDDLFMWGRVGVGKTYAMAALLKVFVRNGYECERTNFDDFCVEVRSTWEGGAKTNEKELGKRLKRVDKLFIDDLGMRSKAESDFAFITFYGILNRRQERMLPTYISTNKSIEQLGAAFDSRIASRLKTMVEIHMEGKDRRIKC